MSLPLELLHRVASLAEDRVWRAFALTHRALARLLAPETDARLDAACRRALAAGAVHMVYAYLDRRAPQLPAWFREADFSAVLRHRQCFSDERLFELRSTIMTNPSGEVLLVWGADALRAMGWSIVIRMLAARQDPVMDLLVFSEPGFFERMGTQPPKLKRARG
jgi:hypothetical protein